MSGRAMHGTFRVILVEIFLAVFCCVHLAHADISVSPVALYLSDEVRNGRVYLHNDGNRDNEVEIGVGFGYPVSDDQGTVTFRFLQTASSDEPSATGWIRVFPERFTLPAGESQIVVVIASPPSELPDGEYWARPVFTFRSLAPVLEGAPGNVEESHLVLSMNYRSGSVYTGVDLRGITVKSVVNKVYATLDLQRKGNAAFLGTIECRLRAPNGSIVGCETTEVAVYHSLKRRIEIETSSLYAGDYSAEIEVNTNRRGNNPGDILHSPTILGKAEFAVMGVSREDVASGVQPLPLPLPVGTQEHDPEMVPTDDIRDQTQTRRDMRESQSKAIEDALKHIREMEILLANLLKSVPEGRND